MSDVLFGPMTRTEWIDHETYNARNKIFSDSYYAVYAKILRYGKPYVNDRWSRYRYTNNGDSGISHFNFELFLKYLGHIVSCGSKEIEECICYEFFDGNTVFFWILHEE